MRNKDMQDIHDEIWQQIYDRQKQALQLDPANMLYINDSDNTIFHSAQHVKIESEKIEK